MKKLILIFFLLLIVNSTNSYSFDRVSFGFFYQSLSPYGEWIEVEPEFYVWKPVAVRYEWRPYYYGRWVWTRYGWYWVSTEPFGWIVFHYGRWHYDDYYGWIWIPGYEWAPAWVEWRYNDDYIGWAPLPPYAVFRIHIGIHFTKRWHHPVHHWTFIRYRNFYSDNPVRYYEEPRRVERFFGNTRHSVDYRYEDDRIINRGIEPNLIERQTGRRIYQAEIIETQNRRGERILRDGDRPKIELYRPNENDITRNRLERIEARRSERKMNLDLENIDRSVFQERREGRQIENESRIKNRESRSGEQKYDRKRDLRESDRNIEQRRIERREDQRIRPEIRKDEERKIERRQEMRPERREREIEIRREQTPSREKRSEPSMQERNREPRERNESNRPSRERQR